jgi:hypothetical protein
MASPNRRTWLLTELARDRQYRLWFCERERRWEVEDRGELPGRAEGAAASAARRGVGAPRLPYRTWPAPD